MRFGMFIPQGWRFDLVGIDPAEQWATMAGIAQAADRSEHWESVWVYDHFHTTPAPSDEATHEAWSLMAALAASTQRVRLGQMCTCASYRNPMYLAKVAATVDLISGGRTEMGIGGGWYEHEWRAYGYGFPRPGVRLGRLDESVQIMQQAWRTGRATLAGKHYQVTDAICQPTPLQQGGIPIWLAGGGEKVTLRIAAKYADYTNFDGTPAGFAHKSQVLAEHCAEVGTDFDAIVRSANYNVFLGRTEAEVARRRQAYVDRVSPYLTTDQVAGQLRAFDGMPGTGTVQQVIDNLGKLREQGLSYAICYFPDAAYDREVVELFHNEVIPALQ
ncbi:LLM class F420-dependent oxidoreductase [Granulicoccus phenolivorans]|uniref:LLM class F420-dependent oxidoreductase n=1 Tax=Granulicoccus phenolivorans TaxID=266854 RepID=UPI0004224ABD|nr:LLM class F420-dependent oxidoreductase [Granulicoccus phenolivorans]